MRQRSAALVLVACVTLGVASQALAAPIPPRRDHFANSASLHVQAEVDRGVDLLHSFQWAEAAQVFDRAARREPRCAMCHWGKAMALYPVLSGWPTAEAMAQARRELRLARQQRHTTARERGYLAAADLFFRDTPLGPRERLTGLSDALQSLHRTYPTDVDAAAFYGLALVALANEEPDPVPRLGQALDLLAPEFRAHPEHPGIAHYLIHAADVPQFAVRGVDAARAYAQLAPDSSHAVHMPSHIFVRLGLWSEVIASNRRAASIGASAAADHHGDPGYQLHALDYLVYALLQAGDEAGARTIARLTDVSGADPARLTYERAYSAARLVVELQRWAEAASLSVPDLPANFLVTTHWARTIGSARLGDVDAARGSLARLREAATARQTMRARGGPVSSEELLEVVEAEGWIAFAEGRMDEAIAALTAAAERDEADSGESTTVPPREMLGDLLLEAGRFADALDAYDAALQRAPNRFNSLFGAGRAAEAIGGPSQARPYFARLTELAVDGADRPELAHAAQSLHD